MKRMKKGLLAVLVLTVMMMLVACGGNDTQGQTPAGPADEPAVNEPAVNEPAVDEPVVDEPVVDEPVAPVEINPELSAMMAKILTDVGELPAIGEMALDSETFAYYAFVEYQEGMEGLVSEAMMGSIAHSVVLVKVPDNMSVSEVAETMEANADPRKWICVEAEKTIVSVKDDIVLLVMTQAATADAINDNFMAL